MTNARLKRAGARRLLVLANRQGARKSPRLTNDAASFARHFQHIARLESDAQRAAAGVVVGGAERVAFARGIQCEARREVRRTVKRFERYGLPKRAWILKGTHMHKELTLQHMFGRESWDKQRKRSAGGRNRNTRAVWRNHAFDASNPKSAHYLWEPDYVQ